MSHLAVFLKRWAAFKLWCANQWNGLKAAWTLMTSRVLRWLHSLNFG